VHIISIIIPAPNEEGSLSALLSAIRRQGADHEVIVVGGGSRDSTLVQWTNKRFPEWQCHAIVLR